MVKLLREDAARWVLYKLDQGLDHVLVDEAQDTSPEQWRIVKALADDFFSGEGARGDRIRTIFAVGDEKQSIFGFQGARRRNSTAATVISTAASPPTTVRRRNRTPSARCRCRSPTARSRTF